MREIENADGLGGNRSSVDTVTVRALAALVLRQARTAIVDGRMVSGIDRRPGSAIGLIPEDRKVMALVSRACLIAGMPDRGAEIHELLACCNSPLRDWLPLGDDATLKYGSLRLINEDTGTPSPETSEVANGFSNLTAGVEEALFQRLTEILDRQPTERANHFYTTVREFVVRHPVCDDADLKQLYEDLPTALWVFLQQIYEIVPSAWAIHNEVPCCAYCGNAMRGSVGGHLSCRSGSCRAKNQPSRPGVRKPLEGLLRVTRGIRQYWVEPGVDEIALFDALKERGVCAQLYPFRDRVDIAIGEVGIDLKAYSSPELLGVRIRRNRGGLAHYEKKWLVIPDWLLNATPSYLERLFVALESARTLVRCLSVTDAYRELTDA